MTGDHFSVLQLGVKIHTHIKHLMELTNTTSPYHHIYYLVFFTPTMYDNITECYKKPPIKTYIFLIESRHIIFKLIPSAHRLFTSAILSFLLFLDY